MGRPKKAEAPGEVLAIRLSPDDRASLDRIVDAQRAKAVEAGLLGAAPTRTDVVRALIRREAANLTAKGTNASTA